MNKGKPQFLALGEILKPWGYRGEVKARILTDFPERLIQLQTAYLGPETRAVPIERARLHSGFAIVKFQGYDTPESVKPLRAQLIQIPVEEAAVLREGQYYQHQIVGLEVRTAEGEELGTIEEILETGANDVYVVRRPGGEEILLPAIRDVVKEIDLEQGRVTVTPTPGLL